MYIHNHPPERKTATIVGVPFVDTLFLDSRVIEMPTRRYVETCFIDRVSFRLIAMGYTRDYRRRYGAASG